MPTYCYYCEACDEHFEAFHSMKSIETVCQGCKVEGRLTRVPSIPIYVKKKNAGNVVKQHIEEAREQIKADKKEARKDHR
jgi:putative FmdB family regulatory protein